MRFKQFLNEGYTVIEEPEDFKKLAMKDCKAFLKMMKKSGTGPYSTYLYRGMNKSGLVYGSKDVRTDRKAKDSSPSEAALMDLINKTHKLPPRSEVLFATTSANQAELYGKEFIVLPAGRFQMFYYNYVRDMFQTMCNYSSQLLGSAGLEIDSFPAKEISKMKNYKEFINAVSDRMWQEAKSEWAGYDQMTASKPYADMTETNKNMDTMFATVTKNKYPSYYIGEVSVICKKYYYIPAYYPGANELIQDMMEQV